MWLFSTSFLLKLLSHLLHLNGRAPVWILMWATSDFFCVKRSEHNVHSNGCSPRCVNLCLWRSLFSRNFLSHSSQSKFFSSECVFMCRRMSDSSLIFLPHNLHAILLFSSLKHTFWCWTKLLFWLKTFPHMLHPNCILFRKSKSFSDSCLALFCLGDSWPPPPTISSFNFLWADEFFEVFVWFSWASSQSNGCKKKFSNFFSIRSFVFSRLSK